MINGMSQRGLIRERMGLEFDKEQIWFVTHVEESSGLFYLHLLDPSISVKYERLYQEIEGAALSNKLRDFASLAKVGDVCLAKFSEDEQWYRAQVLSVEIETGEVEVFFIDYGNGEFTARKSLKMIPEEFCELPAQAWQCRLANVEPVGGVWSKEAVELLKELINERELKGTPSHLCKSGAISMKLFADEEKSVLVAQQLVMAGFAHWKRSHSRASSSPSSSSSSSNSLSIKVKPGQLGQLKVKRKQYLDLCVSYCESPDMFFCQPVEHGDDLTAMQDELQAYYSSNQATDLVAKSATIGQICCARFSDDESWYRGMIRSVCESSKFEIQFVDFGNSEILPLKEIKVLSPAFLHLPMLGLKCSLYGIKLQSNGSSTELLTKFEEFALDKQLVAHVKEVDETGKMKIILYDTTDKDEININNELVKAGFATSLYPAENLNRPAGKSTSSQSASQSTVQHKYVSMSIENDVTELSYVVFGSDPFNFSCQFAKNADALENMMQELNNEYYNLNPSENQLKSAGVGSPCCAKYHEDDRYYRAEILSITNLTAKVHYVDYGNDDECSVDSLKHLKKEYLKLPKQAFKCKLAGIQPKENGYFSTEASTKFNDIVLDKEFNLTVVNGDSDGYFHVNLVEQNSRNITNLDVAKILIESGYAEPASSWADKGTKGPFVTNAQYKEITVPIEEYIDVVPTEVSDLNQFCCQMVEQADDIDAMMAALDKTYKGSEPNRNIAWKNGMPVAALYPVDGGWYRAVLSSVSKGQAEVTYIDFGNNEKISLHDIRPLYKDFMTLPAQAFVCSLYDVTPEQGQEWSTSDIDMFSNLILEKHLIAFVKRKDQSNVHFIELLDTMSNRQQQLNIADLLKEKGVTQKASNRSNQSAPISSMQKPAASKQTESPSINVKDVEIVTVSFVEDPSSFYIQLLSNMERIDEIAEELDVEYSQLSPEERKITSIANGKLVAAKYTADGYWYRGEIQNKIDAKTVHIKYIDHGNGEDSSVSGLKELTQSLVKDPGYALHCCLNQIFPTSDSWSDASISQFSELTEEKTLQAKFITKTPPFKVELLDNGIDIAEELLKKNLATKNKASTKSAAQQGFIDVKLNVGDVERVYVSHVDDHGMFFCQLERLEGKLDEVMGIIAESCPNATPLSSVQPSQALCAMYSEDEAWYRGQVLKMIDINTAHVCFVDYGNSENVHISKLRQITSDLLKEPKFAIRCSLFDNNKKLKDNAVTEFTTKTADKPLQMSVKAIQGDNVVVELCDESGTNIAADLYAKVEPLTNNNIQDVVYPNQVIKTNVLQELYVTHTDSLTDLYVQFVSNSDPLNDIMEAIENSKKVRIPSNRLKSGMPCVAMFSEDGGWYRGVVERFDATKAIVRFVDYGNTEEKSIDDIYQLTKDLAAEPPFAIHCLLKGAASNASTEEIEKFKENVFDKSIKGKFLMKANGKYELELNDFTFSNAKATDSITQVVIPSIPIKPGLSLDCYISHTESLNEFYVQPYINIPDLDLIGTKMADISANMAAYPSLSGPTAGQYCCAKFSEDGSWYRSEILEKVKENFKVRFIDYGNTDTVALSDLKAMPKESSKFQRLAIHCKLHGQYKNSDDDIDKFVNITIDQLVSVTFVEEKDDCFILEIMHEGKLLNQMFSQTKQLIVETTKKTPLQASNSNEFTYLPSPAVIVEYAEPNVNLGQTANVVIPYVLSPEEFYCQLSTEMGRLEELMEKLENHYGSLKHNQERLTTSAVPGMPCGAKYSDDCWYRTVIEKLENQNEVKVTFVDYGNSEIVKLADIKSLKSEFLDYPVFAIKCGMVSVSEKVDNFESRLLEKEYDMKIVALVDGKYMVELFDGNKSLNEEFANKAGPSESVTPTIRSFSTVKLNCNDSEKVYVLDGSSPSEFYCHLVRYEDELAGLFEEIASEVANLQPMDQPQVGQPCIGLFSEDEIWYRGIITETQSDKSKIFFVDYANEEWVSNRNIKTIPEKLLQLPLQAIKCSLSQCHGVKLSDKDINLMKEKCGEDVFSITVVSADDDKLLVTLKNERTGEVINEAFKSTKDNDANACASGKNTVKSYKDPPLVQGATYDAFCYFVKSAKAICCQLVSFQEQLEELMENIHAYCSNNTCSLVVPTIGLACLALFEDGTWYRAKIKDVNEAGVMVHFVDYGNEACVTSKDLREIRLEDLDLPVTCVDCYFADSVKLNIQPSDLSVIEDICYDNTLSVTVDKIVSPCVISGDVFPKDSHESIRQILMGKLPVENVENVSEDVSLKEKPISQGSGIPNFTLPDITNPNTQETFCTFVTSSAELCCQPVSIQEQLDELMEEIATYCSGNEDRLTDPAIGQACLAKYSADEAWYRAEITEVDKANNTVMVDFVDYGNHEAITLDNLVRIAPDFLRLAVCCIRVEIAGLDSDAGPVEEIKSWLEENCLEQTLVIQELSGSGREFQGKITTIETSIEVNDIIMQKFGTKKTEDAPRNIQDYSKPDITEDSTERITFTHLTSVNKVSCHLLKYEDDFNKMMDEIAEYCGSCDKSMSNLSVGQACLGLYPIDGGWYRAKVLSCSNGIAKLKYVDYDNEEEVTYEDIREMKPEFMKLPCLIISCLLHDVHEEDLDQEKAKLWLADSCCNNEYNIMIIKVAGDCIEVNMYHPGADETVNDELYANFALEETEVPNIASENIGTPVILPEEPAESEKKPSVENKDVDSITMDGNGDEITNKNLRYSDPVFGSLSNISVTCSYIDDDLTVHCQLSQYTAELDTLMAHIAEYCADISTKPDDCAPGLACFAQFPDDLEWYRAEVLEKEGILTRVLFVDYGNSALVTEDQLRIIDQSFLLLPKVSIPCIVQGIDNLSESTETAKPWIEEQLIEKSVELNILDNLKDGSFKVTLTVDGFDFTAMLDSQFKNLPVSNIEDKVVDVIGNRAATVNDIAPPGEITPAISVNEEKPCLAYTLPVLNTGDKLDVICTHIDSSKEIFCQLVKYQNELDALAELITDYCNNGQQGDISIGSACLARYSVDQQWYRAEVREISGDQVTVFMVDYGNTDTLPLADTRTATPEITILPITSVKCKLHDVHDEDLDMKSVMEWLSANIIDAELQLEVSNVLENYYDCTLTKPGSEISINDELYALFALMAEEEVVENNEEMSNQVNSEIVPESETASNESPPESVQVSGELVPEFEQVAESEQGNNESSPESVKSSNEPVSESVQVNNESVPDSAQVDNESVSEPLEVNDESVPDSAQVDNEPVSEPVEVIDESVSDFAQIENESVPERVEVNNESVPELEQVNNESVPEAVEVNTESVPKSAQVNSESVPEAVEVSTSLSFESTAAVASNESFKYNHIALGTHSQETVFCTHVDSTKRIYCQQVKYQDQIDEMSVFIEEHCKKASNPLNQFDIGTACLARFSVDQQWYRAEITALNADDIDVFFVDYGNSDTVAITETRAVNEKITSLPAASIICQLHDVHNEDLDMKSVNDWLHENVADHEFVLDIRGKLDEVYDCVLRRPGEDVSLNDTLYAQFALFHEKIDESAPETKIAVGFNDTPKHVISSKDINTDACLTMHLSLATSPSNFWCQFDETSQDLIQLMAEINDQASKLENFDATPAIGCFCCAKYDEDEQWYRGEVVEICSDNEFLIKFVDYGNVEKLTLDKIKVLEDRHHSLCRQAVECALYGVKATAEDGIWSDDCIAQFEHICAERLLKIQVVKKDSDKIHVIVTVDECEVSVNQIIINDEFAIKDDTASNGLH